MTSGVKPTPLVRRSAAPATKADFREQLRYDFGYSCAYCSIEEQEAQAIGFQVDHYWPQAHFKKLSNVYENWYWSCQPCNRNKGEYFPPEDRPNEAIIRIDLEHFSEHVVATGTTLSGLTSRGELNILILDLNRQPLTRLRRLRKALYEDRRLIENGLRVVMDVAIDQLPIRVRAEVNMRRARMRDLYGRAIELAPQVRNSMRSPFLDKAKKAKRIPPARRPPLAAELGTAPEGMSSEESGPESFDAAQTTPTP